MQVGFCCLPMFLGKFLWGAFLFENLMRDSGNFLMRRLKFHLRNIRHVGRDNHDFVEAMFGYGIR